MFIEETVWIKNAIADVPQLNACSVLDIGSSNYDFRTRIQPHIYSNVHRPLMNRGCSITCADIKADEGVDLVVDLTDADLPADTFARKFDLVLCCNILEHVRDRDVFLKNLIKFSKQGGYVLFTVPTRYPKHNDPIDTMYRPSMDELVSFIADYINVRPVSKTVLRINDRQYYASKPGRILDYLTLKFCWNMWRYIVAPFRWQVTCVLFEVLDDKRAP